MSAAQGRGSGVGKHQRGAGDFGAGANNRAVNRETPGAAQVARGTWVN
jgi:hypothetical protein